MTQEKTMQVNNQIWDNLYQTYQKGVDVPGVKYPNEHLVRFVAAVSKHPKTEMHQAAELGFGNITNMSMIARSGYQVKGLEVSQESVDRARNAIKSRGLESVLSVDTFTGNTLPLPDASVDLLVGLQCVYYNLDQKLFAKECARVLKPGGKLFFSFFSPRHGYMDYIKGRPGGIVKFTEQHPNPRLHGLELFLFSRAEQFQEIYGEYFDLQIGADEFDTEPLFMSWTYVAGFKKDKPNTVKYPISQPVEPAETDRPLREELGAWEKMNSELWARKYEARYQKSLNPGSQYPNEHCIRFLATKNRGEASKFYKNIGKEDQNKTQNETMLEIMPENGTNLLMAEGFGYKAHGLSSSQLVVDKTREFLEKEKSSASIELCQNRKIPFGEGFFDCIMSEKAGSHCLDQKALIAEVTRVTKPGSKIFIGYLSPRHGYFQWAKSLGHGYWQITDEHPDASMRGMTLFTGSKADLKKAWSGKFDVEIKCTEFSMHSYFSSFYWVKGTRQ